MNVTATKRDAIVRSIVRTKKCALDMMAGSPSIEELGTIRAMDKSLDAALDITLGATVKEKREKAPAKTSKK